VREAIFNALGSLGAVDGARVLDLFAGTGALGIEALSRGADHATFVEHDRRAVASLRTNLAATGTSPQSEVVVGDAERFVDDAVAAGRHFDLALLDPPYAYVDEAWASLLARLPVDVAVIESDREVPIPPGWGTTRSKRYGTTLVAIVRRVPPGPG
jgi:16S rRNA (guanine966-N2)-methyltransferase